MAMRGRAGNRKQRLQILAAYHQDLFANKDRTYYPTITEFAKRLHVTTPTIYRDLERLRSKLGVFVIPSNPKLGSRGRNKKNGK